jgi:hypothetical protein
LSDAQVPAPQLASPWALGAGFFFAVALPVAFPAAVAGADDDAGAALPLAAGAALAAGVASVDGVVVAAAAVVAGEAVPAAGAAAGESAAFLPPQPAAEHDDCPAGPAPALDAVAGATSFAFTGLGSLPPQATRAVAPSAASTEAKFSNERLDRMKPFSF